MQYEVSVTKVINTLPRNAFRAFADGATWSRWFSDDTKVDLRVGGAFSNADGDRGEYLAIEEDKLLRFTWDGSFAGSRIELNFAPRDQAAEVTLRHYQLAAQADADKMQSCWRWTLDNLASFLETGKGITMSEWKAQQPQ